jgi:DNA-binding response OmpR family regulator
MIKAVARVLLVEDEVLIRELLAEVLRDAGLEVVEARDADDAIRLLAGHIRVDILLTDVQMPGKLDGVDLALKLRQADANMPVMIVSAYTHRVMDRIKQLSPAPLLASKPYDLRKIVERVQELADLLP